MSDADDNSRLEIGHVLFIDIAGYSKLLNEEQKEPLDQRTEIVLASTTRLIFLPEPYPCYPFNPWFC